MNPLISVSYTHLDVKVKRFLNAIMQETLEPIRNRRKEFSKDIPAVYEMLQKGCEVARAAAAETLADVKKRCV